MYHEKKIALFLSHIYGDYQKNACQGVIDRATEFGYQTEVYSSTSDGEDLGKYGIGEESILRIPNFDEFEGIIIASGTYPNLELKDELMRLVREKSSCPIIEIADAYSEFPVVSLENNLTAGTLTEHMILAHGHKHIAFLGCEKERFFSDRREKAYRNMMDKHGLKVSEHDVFLGEYTKESVAEAFDFFTNGGKELPEAVICYNDRIALLLMMEIIGRGYRIPEDIALTGCDFLEEGQNVDPPLTTVTFPLYQLGTEAVNQLLKSVHGEEIPSRTCIFAEPYMAGSCGCNMENRINSIFHTDRLVKRISDVESSIFTSMRMSADFSHVDEVEEGMDVLEQYVKKIEGCSEFYLCLYPDWDKVSDQIRELTDLEEESLDESNMELIFALKDGKRLPVCSFQKGTLLPEYISRESTSAFIISPLYFEDREFGYVVMAFENNQMNFHFQLVHWIMNITELLQRLCEAKGQKIMLDKLESIYMKDALTGLANRHGYEYHLPGLLAPLKQGDVITGFIFDLDGLKAINDEFGHGEGDFALQVVGQAIERLRAFDGMICTRFGGDEFYVLATGMDENKAIEFVDSITQYLDHYNKLSDKPYALAASGGFAQFTYEGHFDNDDFLKVLAEADKEMYTKKRAKRSEK